ncbi:TadE/TadG family type IV pilus assembly protein [Stappia sp.]|jgi:Flp pilus assembly protein TadG|uniref:TadE/TadG family type IV pilus assembly protein n=1 Tax=Stappia sp. TaxID=1870903 RepID=UPI003A98E05B
MQRPTAETRAHAPERSNDNASPSGETGRARPAAFGRLINRLGRETRAVAAVEFALVLPFMLLLLLGMIELDQAMTVDRKVSQVASSIADLVAQTDKLKESDIADLLKISGAILEPYPENNLKLVVASIWIKDVNQPRVVWSRALNTSRWNANNTPPIQIPEGLTQDKDTYLIVTRAVYSHRPTFAALLKDVFSTDTIELSDTYYMRPRVSSEVECCS